MILLHISLLVTHGGVDVINRDVDIAVIGGGPAGLAAGISAKSYDDLEILILDRNHWLGGILPQCIHDGFGLEEIGISLTGPEYAQRYIQSAEAAGVQCITETMVLQVTKNREIIAVNKEGLQRIRAKAIILATGCREKTRWDAMIPGDRPSGIYTAGVAQMLINLYNIMPGKTFLILGSGDVGLIMARRLTLEGATVKGVLEILPFTTGLPRNVVQCLEDYDIPLLLNHTVVNIYGKGRVEKVTTAQVDETRSPITKTEKHIMCDTLLLSLGLIPENEIALSLGIKLDEATGGPRVNQDFETTLKGFYSIGNSLQIYDTVDKLSHDADKAGKSIAKRICNSHRRISSKKGNASIILRPGKGVKHVTPQIISTTGLIDITIRAEKPFSPATLMIFSDDTKIFVKKLRYATPANLITIQITVSEQNLMPLQTWEVSLND